MCIYIYDGCPAKWEMMSVLLLFKDANKDRYKKKMKNRRDNPRKGMKGTGLGLKEKNAWVAECTVPKII